jgi:two-component system cell cycle sensor histidine kinase/response regulator CckA
VLVGTEPAEVTGEPAESLPPGRYATLTVSDTGAGMTAEVRDRLFEPFFTTKTPDRGTGLGLATVYGIVGDAGGHIGVESEPGAGTTFRIMLPLAEGRDEPPRETVERRPAKGHGERVAVLDDDERVRDLVVRILRDNGYQAVALSEAADSGLSSVALLVLGVGPGPAVADRLRGRNPGLRVLYLSGRGEDELRRRCELDEACRLVRKPFTAVELLAAVEEVLSPGHRATQPVPSWASI